MAKFLSHKLFAGETRPTATMFSYDTMMASQAPSAPKAPPSVDNTWVTVTWMPHSSLSQSSHVSLGIRSIHAVLDDGNSLLTPSAVPAEWRVQVSVRGMAGLPLVSVSSSSTASPVFPRKGSPSEDAANLRHRSLYPSVSNATHDCVLDQVLQVPIRWRDLPRDAYLAIEVLEQGDSVLFEASMPLFDTYGRLRTGLQRIDLTTAGSAATSDPSRNPGLVTPPARDAQKCEWEEDDPVWKASRILYQLERFETSRKEGVVVRTEGAPPSVGSETSNFDEIPSVPWLDALTKKHCEDVLNVAKTEQKENHFCLFKGLELPQHVL